MSVQLLERVELAGGVALRLLDAATRLPVREGLRCELRRRSDDALLARAVATPSGVHHWSALGPLWRDAPSPPSPPAAARAEIRVTDTLDRFLPLRLAWGALPAGITEVTLCSAPGRQLPAGWATLQAWLADEAGAPAAWARVVATGAGGLPVPGMSDGQGRLALYLPFPRPERRTASSPPASPPSPPSPPVPGLALAAAVSLAFQYSPSVAAEAAPHEAPRLDLWLAQPPCAALAHVDGSTCDAVRVSAGVPLVLRTLGLPPDRSDLRLVPL
jgi:hypothetical protein